MFAWAREEGNAVEHSIFNEEVRSRHGNIGKGMKEGTGLSASCVQLRKAVAGNMKESICLFDEGKQASFQVRGPLHALLFTQRIQGPHAEISQKSVIVESPLIWKYPRLFESLWNNIHNGKESQL